MTSQVPGPCDEVRANCTCFNLVNGSNICGCLPGYEITRNEGGNPLCQGSNNSNCMNALLVIGLPLI